MNNPLHKSTLALSLLLLGSVMMSCEIQVAEAFEYPDNGSSKLLIIPDHPDSEDLIMAIETICGNESAVILEFKDKQILYKRYVNSLMMMPCSPRADTTVIGQLEAGHYQLVHCMIDKNHFLTDSIVLLDTIPLFVK